MIQRKTCNWWKWKLCCEWYWLQLETIFHSLTIPFLATWSLCLPYSLNQSGNTFLLPQVATWSPVKGSYRIILSFLSVDIFQTRWKACIMLLRDLARLGMLSPGQARSISLSPKLSAKPQCGPMARSQEIHRWFDFFLRPLFSTMCLCVYFCVCMYTWVHTQEFLCFIFFMKEKKTHRKGQKRVLYPLELELETFVSLSTWILGAELGFFA